MQGKGAEQFVVVMKSVKADRAKGLHYLALCTGQPNLGGASRQSKTVGGIYEII